jgi:CCR4-NOT transcription complex subunit 3
MERFKACEKEMKTKAFSKEGLLASSKMDPKEKERHEMGHFLMEMVEELGKQVEQAEAEQESLQIALKKGRKDPGKVERLSEVEHLVERHKWHQGRLELILRLLENGNIQTEQVWHPFPYVYWLKVASIKEDIDYYVNENQAVDFTEDEDIYNDLNLQDEEDVYGVGDNDHQSSLDAQSVTEDHPPTPQKEEIISKPKDAPVTTNRRASVATNRPFVTSTAATAPLPLPNGVPKPPLQAARPPTELKYASAVAAATNPASLPQAIQRALPHQSHSPPIVYRSQPLRHCQYSLYLRTSLLQRMSHPKVSLHHLSLPLFQILRYLHQLKKESMKRPRRRY